MAITRKLPPLSAWNAESLRFTAMYPEAMPPSRDEIWRSIIGDDPQETLIQNSPKIVQEMGPWKKGKLIAGRMEGRFDWLYTTVPTIDTPPASGLGSYLEALDALKRVAFGWFPKSRAPQRIAFGTTLFQPVSDHATGYQRLGEYLSNSVKVDPLGSRDFSYRINRPREVVVGNSKLKVNRLSNWSVAFFSSLSFATSNFQVPPIIKGEPDYVLRIEIDINTATESDNVLAVDQLNDIAEILIGQSNEIVENGDIP